VLAKSLVLIVESDPYVALDLSASIEELGGRVAGPSSDVADALVVLASELVSGAILDWHLPHQTAAPVADWLADRKIPFIIHAAEGLSARDRDRHPTAPVLIKPLQSRTVLARLIIEMRQVQRETSRLSRGL
jgi:DNA-binding response OmpR family regulator